MNLVLSKLDSRCPSGLWGESDSLPNLNLSECGSGLRTVTRAFLPAFLKLYPQRQLHYSRIRQRLVVNAERLWLIQPVAHRVHIEPRAVGHVEHIPTEPQHPNRLAGMKQLRQSPIEAKVAITLSGLRIPTLRNIDRECLSVVSRSPLCSFVSFVVNDFYL
jgi:hypothetical protein